MNYNNEELMNKYIQTRDSTIRDKIVENNMKLVRKVTKKFTGNLEYDDLYQVGSIGLMKAVDTYKPEYGCVFATHAVNSIWGYTKRFVDFGNSSVGRTRLEKIKKLQGAFVELERKLGRTPTNKEAAKVAKIKVSEVEELIKLNQSMQLRYLSEAVSEDDGNTVCLEDTIVANKNDYDNVLDKIIVKSLLRDLKDKEKDIIHMRYFMDMTQEEVGKIYGMTQQGVALAEKKILKKLRLKIKSYN